MIQRRLGRSPLSIIKTIASCAGFRVRPSCLTVEQRELRGLSSKIRAAPRKCLVCRTPAEVPREELAMASDLQWRSL